MITEDPTSQKQKIRASSYEVFQSEREAAIHTFRRAEEHHNQVTKEFSLQNPVQVLLSHFKTIFSQRGYKVTEVFPGKIMLTKLSLRERINYIFWGKKPNCYLISVKTEEYQGIRKISIRSLAKQIATKDLDQIGAIQRIIEENPLQISKVTNSTHQKQQPQTSEYYQDVYSLQATSTYMYHKIFVDKKYSMAQKMNTLIESKKNKNIVDLPETEAFITVGCIQEITHDMLQGFNCTRKELLDILCHCRKSVEDYYHDRIFKLPKKDDLELERGSVQAEIMEKIPQTVKQFQRMLGENNSISILRLIFLCNYIFDVECGAAGYSEQEKKTVGRKMGKISESQIKQKVRLLKLWGYSEQIFEKSLEAFLN